MKEPFAPIYDMTPFTAQDFPGRLAAIVWISGCNMRCPFCHNPGIVLCRRGRIPPEAVFQFLRARTGLLDGVVLSGGEAAATHGIVDLARAVKTLGFAVKLDTNGARPDILRQLLAENLLDRIALDYKAPPEKFRRATGSGHLTRFCASLDILLSQNIVPVDIRTTFVPGLLDDGDIGWIKRDLERRGFTGNYEIQKFREPPGGTLASRQGRPA